MGDAVKLLFNQPETAAYKQKKKAMLVIIITKYSHLLHGCNRHAQESSPHGLKTPVSFPYIRINVFSFVPG